MNITEAFQKREFKSTGSNSDPAEAFELRKIRLRSRKQGAWKKQSRPQGTAMVSPKGQTIQKAVDEIHNRNRTGKKTRARVAKTKAARKRDIEQRRTAHEGKERTAFTEPSIFADRALSTGKRRHSERVAPGLGPGPAGGIRES